MIHRIEIAGWRPATANELMNCHWRTKHKLKKRDVEFVGVYAHMKGFATMYTPLRRRVSLEITLTGHQKQADPDAYWKSLLDALVQSELLKDDSREWCELGTVTYRCGSKEEAGTVIVLEDL